MPLITEAAPPFAILPPTSGTVSCDQDIDYYPYGGVENDYCPNVAQNYKFTGKERDTESGLDNFGARYNASSVGRWMSPDAINLTDERILNPANTPAAFHADANLHPSCRD